MIESDTQPARCAQATSEAFGEDPRFELLAVSLDDKPEIVERYVERHGHPWPQWWLGKDRGWEMVRAYGRRGIPSIFLIGPDGRLLTGSIRGTSMVQTVRKHLADDDTPG